LYLILGAQKIDLLTAYAEGWLCEYCVGVGAQEFIWYQRRTNVLKTLGMRTVNAYIVGTAGIR
jgi:hypothetical protein